MKTFKETFDEKNAEIIEDMSKSLEEDLVEFILDLDETQLNEELMERYFYLVEALEELEEYEEYEEDSNELSSESPPELNEAAIRKKISNADKLKRKKLYRKNKSKIKLKAKKLRKTSKFKRYKKKAKKMASRGKTASGKRKTHFI